MSQRLVAVVGRNNTQVEVTGQNELLARISSVSSSAGLATESTLLQILNNMIASQDVEILLVRDVGNGNQVVQQIREYDQGTGTWTTRYEDVNGNPYTPVGPLEYLDPSAVLNLILTELLDQGSTLKDIQLDTSSLAAEDFATEATLSALNAQFTAVTRTPSLIRATGAGSIAAGARSISVYNAGAVAGSILGVAGNILAGEILSFDAGGENDTLSAFAYDGTGTTLVITTIV